MKNFRKVQAIILTIVITLLPMLSSYQIREARAEETLTYTIDGQGLPDKITDSAGNTVPGYSYCLDSKEHTPFASVTSLTYTRCKLSELTPYVKDQAYDAGKGYTDEVKSRILKILMEEDAIKTYIESLNDSAAAARERIVTAGRNTKTAAQMSSGWNSICNEFMKKLVWLSVHEQSQWDEFVTDFEGNISPKADNYYYGEKKYGYFSDDPMNDPDSLWNIFYQPVMNYIDTELRDYYADGYDAWVYVTTNSSYQNMLGTPIGMEIAKVDSVTGEPLAGANLVLTPADSATNTALKASMAELKLLQNGTEITCKKYIPSTATGKCYVEFTSGNCGTVIPNLPAGTYILSETTAPDGYACSGKEITFSVDVNGYVYTSGSKGSTINSSRKFEIKNTQIKFLKKDATTDETLSGVKIELMSASDEKDIGSITSASDPVVIYGLESEDAFYLREEAAKAGYITVYVDQDGNEYDITNDWILINMNEDGKPEIDDSEWYADFGLISVSDDTVILKNTQTSVDIAKVDITNKQEVAGAHIQILNSSNAVVDEWDSSATAAHNVKGLLVGEQYTLHETIAPDGYTVAADTTFTIGTDGTVAYSGTTRTTDGALLLEDSLTKVAISKKSTANGTELPGAELSLTGNADWEKILTQFAENDEHKVAGITDTTTGALIGIKWISTNEELSVEGLTTEEEYILQEDGAPLGYAYSENIRFKLEGQGTNTQVYVYNKDSGNFEESSKVEMFDDLDTGTLVLTKTIDGLNVTDEELAGGLKFTIQNEEDNYLAADGSIQREVIELTLSQFTRQSDGTYILTIENVPSGTYLITEVNTAIEGYQLQSTSIVSGTGVVQYQQTTNVLLTDKYEKKITETSKTDKHDKKITGSSKTDTENSSGKKTTSTLNTGDAMSAEILRLFTLLLLSGTGILLSARRLRKE